MSAIILLPIIIPAATAAWPIVAAAATAAAASMGYAAITENHTAENDNEVNLELDHADALSAEMGPSSELFFEKDGNQIRIYRDLKGKVALHVSGPGTNQELENTGQTMANALLRHYAYHQVVTEMKRRDFALVDEEHNKDGSIRLRVRNFQ